MVEFHSDGFGSFGGLVFENIPADEAQLLIVGIPYESATSGKKGASFGPLELRKLSSDMQTLTRSGLDLNTMAIKDMGNVVVNPIEGSATRSSIEETYSELLKSTTPILTLGGDHSNTYPILKALAQRGTVGIVWFDAHRDVLSELMGSRWSHGSPLRRALELENTDFENVLLVGTRYMENSEQAYIEENNISELRMVDLETKNFDLSGFREKVVEISSRVDYFYVSIDIDVLDPAFAPATGTPVGGGLTTSQLMRMIAAIDVPVRAFDIMEIAPPHDHADITLKAALGLVTEIIGQIKSTTSDP